VLCVVVHGICSTGDLKKVGRVGVKALVYFELVTTFALALGVLLAFVLQPGVGMNVDPHSLDASALSGYTEKVAQATNTPLSLTDLFTILAISLVTSKGAHGVPGSAIVILAATLSAVPAIPAIGLVLVLSVDWFMGMARALTNMIGNCVATVVVGVWEKDIDRQRAAQVLNGDIAVDLRAPVRPEALAEAAAAARF
jgi:aerobic C4-dicarboxylate transport protein